MSRRRQTSNSLRVRALDALRRVDHHDGGIDGRERAIGVFREVFVARCVEQVEHKVLELEGHHRGHDGNCRARAQSSSSPSACCGARPWPLTCPARLIAPPNSSSFSVSVVLPASGCENDRERAPARHFFGKRRGLRRVSSECGVGHDGEHVARETRQDQGSFKRFMHLHLLWRLSILTGEDGLDSPTCPQAGTALSLEGLPWLGPYCLLRV